MEDCYKHDAGGLPLQLGTWRLLAIHSEGSSIENSSD
jgi:hypothetical protein